MEGVIHSEKFAENIISFKHLRNFFESIPRSFEEAARMDGANEFQIFMRLYIPISTPGLATIGLFTALFYWNNWHLAMMFIDRVHMKYIALLVLLGIVLMALLIIIGHFLPEYVRL